LELFAWLAIDDGHGHRLAPESELDDREAVQRRALGPKAEDLRDCLLLEDRG
jgi:hypothetical protein